MHIKDALPDGSVVPAGKGAGELPYLLSQYKGEVLTVEPLLSVFEGFDKLETDQKPNAIYLPQLTDSIHCGGRCAQRHYTRRTANG